MAPGVSLVFLTMAEASSGYLPMSHTDPYAPIDYPKLLRFFTNPDTSSIHSRQIALLKKVCRHNYAGYKVPELSYIAQLLDLAQEKAVDNQEFEEALCVMVELAAKPYVRQKANQELYQDGQAALDAVVSALGRLLSSPLPRVKLAAVAALKRLTEGRDHLRKNDPHLVHVLGGVVREDLRPLPKEYNNAMLLRCGIIEAASRELAKEGAAYAEALMQEAAVLASRAEALSTLRSTGASQAAKEREGEEEGEDEEEERPEEESCWQEETDEEADDAFWDESAEAAQLPEGAEEAEQFREKRTKAAVKRRLVLSLLEVLREFSMHPANTAPLVRADVVATLVELLAVVPRIKDLVVGVSVDILWNLMDSSAEALKEAAIADTRAKLVSKWRTNNGIYRLGSERALWVLKDLLLRLLEGGYRSRDKELRNAVVILLSFITRNVHVHPFFHSTGLLDLLLAYATVADTPPPPQQQQEEAAAGSINPFVICATADPHNYSTTGALDMEFKRLVWGLLANLLAGQCSDIGPRVLASPLMEVLLMYIRRLPNDRCCSSLSSETCPMAERLPESHLPQMHLQALATLINLVPLAPERFLALGGVSLVLQLLRSEPPINPQPDRVQRGMMLLQATASLPVLQDEYGKQGAVHLALHHFLNEHGPEPLRLIALRVLALVCKGHVGNQAIFRREGGPQGIIDAINAYIRKRAHTLKQAHRDPIGEKAVATLRRGGMRTSWAGSGGGEDEQVPALPVCLVSVVWHAILGNAKSESSFLDRGGMESVLDLLETCPVNMRYQVVGLLSDLLHHPASSSYAEAWRSDTNLAAAPQLLLHLWEEEEDRLQVSRPDGVITNLAEPLQQHAPPSKPAGAFSHLDHALSAASGQHAVQMPDLRPRLAATLQQLGTSGTWKEKISTRESAAHAVVAHYEHFKKAEAWRGVASNLEARGIKPISADALLLASVLDENQKRALRVQDHQKALQSKAVARDLQDEERVYKGILLQRDQELHQLRLKRQGMARYKRRPHNNNNNDAAATATAPATGEEEQGPEGESIEGGAFDGSSGGEGKGGSDEEEPVVEVDAASIMSEEAHGVLFGEEGGGVVPLVV